MKRFLGLLAILLVLVAGPVWAMDVTLGWDANTETDLAGYRVYYGTASGVYGQVKGEGLDAGLNTTFTVTGLEKGPTYYFAVTAYDNEATPLESGFSNEVSTNGAPGVPGGIRITVTVDVIIP